MNEAKKIKHQQPGFMAIQNEHTDVEATDTRKQKKHWLDAGVLITWIIVIFIAAAFWYVIAKLL